ncbi:putative arginyl-tRNA--protein transferase [Amylibacter marinus]|uniref:Aspartate/glutamate leucyltransferase n=1 Tax=Amylibacter marinus TaxID=1475483 RepID=A0ABQ5VT26_9RHOB|nr:arginyltransferase [Amylibacter marinus]GLQ34479.1 putative arginyl-tRNA--protein transferase [Amylibacter marinus]
MKHTLPLAPQFYVTAPQPCPYLEGKIERKLFTGLQDAHGKALNDILSTQGFRRSQNVLYRPACADCNACISARIRVADFTFSKSQRRILRRNTDLERGSHTAWATEEQYDLFKTYLQTRHANGGMADMDMFEFAAMIEETPVRTRIVEYQSKGDNGRLELRAACLTDVVADGLSMVYSFFDPEISRNSPGRFMILDHINIAKESGLEYVYLGYWVAGSAKMDYKAEFSALELYYNNQWNKVVDPEVVQAEVKASPKRSIQEQVAAILLPDLTLG